MSALDEIRAGRLDPALKLLQQEVRSNPAEQKHRVFLFQLLSVLGQWERAMVQLNVAGELDDANLHMVHAYREALQCEALRTAIFDGAHSPLIFGQPEPWMARLIDALRLDAAGDAQAAQLVRAEALADAPASSGRINDEAFTWIADADTRLGPILEALINGRYYWVPFCRIKKITVEAPADLRDSVWMPVHFTWTNDGDTVGFIPTRYVGSTGQGDDELCLARKTTWQTPVEGACIGLGQRTLATDSGDYPLMEIRSIEFDVVQPVTAVGAPDAAPFADAA